MFTDILTPTHLIFVLVIALLVLGPKRLPEVGRSLGQGLREFRGSITGHSDAEPRTPTPRPLEAPEPEDPPH
jgi:sec-independent protein translocase protein TatA